jgi:hypothetical protein
VSPSKRDTPPHVAIQTALSGATAISRIALLASSVEVVPVMYVVHVSAALAENVVYMIHESTMVMNINRFIK